MTSSVRMRPNPKWIRGTVGGLTVVNSRRSTFVWEIPYYPAWYFPLEDLDGELRPNGLNEPSDERGKATRYDIVIDRSGEEVVLANAAYRHLDDPALRDLVRIEWAAMDSWFEEDVEVFVHPRSPEVRIDALRSSKRVTVKIGGTVVADSQQPVVLYEADLPPRYYLPQADVRMDLLSRTSTESACPYKGWAHYWNVTVDGKAFEDLAWGYRTPLPESASIAGLVCFYNEKVEIEVDGEPVEQPTTKFS